MAQTFDDRIVSNFDYLVRNITVNEKLLRMLLLHHLITEELFYKLVTAYELLTIQAWNCQFLAPIYTIPACVLQTNIPSAFNERRAEILFGYFAKQSKEVVTHFITVLDQTDNHKAVVAMCPIGRDEHPSIATTMEPSSSSTALPNASQRKTTQAAGKTPTTMTKTFL
jgi:hypothetical protein